MGKGRGWHSPRRRKELTVLGKACSLGWSLAGIWELGFQEGSHHSKNWKGSVPNCANSVVCAEHWLSPRESGPEPARGRGCLCGQPRAKPLDTELLRSLPGGPQATRLPPSDVGGTERVLCADTRRGVSRFPADAARVFTLC